MHKTCNRCLETKPVMEFYRHKKMADGLLNACKDCVRSRVKSNRMSNVDYYRVFDRKRANEPKRVAARKAYAKTERGKERLQAGSKAWVARNPEKRRAHIALNNALRDGRIKRPSWCVDCGGGLGGTLHAHHEDYSKPLEVRWLCVACHYGLHKDRRS